MHPGRAIDLATGIPESPPGGDVLAVMMAEASEAIRTGRNQYAPPMGCAELRASVAARMAADQGMEVDPQREVTVTCGSTEGVTAVLLATVRPGEHVVLLDPGYENYTPGCELCGAVPRYVRLQPPDWRIDLDELVESFSGPVAAVLLNLPHNPTGRMLSAEEQACVASLCRERDALLIEDAVYQELTFRAPPPPFASPPGMAERTVVVGSASKTLAVTGWRVGWVVAPAGISDSVRAVHDLLTVGAPHPLQVAVARGLELLPSVRAEIRSAYRARRDLLVDGLGTLGLVAAPPDGGLFLAAGFDDVDPHASDESFATRLMRDAAVATVPLAAFHHPPVERTGFVRLSFAKSPETIHAGLERLREGLRGSGGDPA
jgi:aminotransferase